LRECGAYVNIISSEVSFQENIPVEVEADDLFGLRKIVAEFS